jgi:TonB family protein
MAAARYPGGATGRASVLLEVQVDRDGRVAGVKVVEGEEPFAAAALQAAQAWRFDPAQRQGLPVAARIRVRLDFTPPAPPPAADAPSVTKPPSAPAKPAQVQEVVVRGFRTEQPADVLSGSEVRQLPGAFGDAFRAIELMPGVTPIVSGLPYFLVRGAPPGDTGFFIDGVRVPALFHLGVGAAVVHPGLIDRVDFYPGAYPARFGRFTGGILSGEAVPFSDHARAEASIRLIDAGVLAETPVDGGRGDVMVSGRYGYPGPVLSAVANALSPGANVDLAYWDYQVRGRWRVTDRDEVSAFVFGSFDQLAASGTSINIEFHRADLRWDHRTSPTGKLRVALTLGYDQLSSAEVTFTSSVPGLSGASSTNTDAIRQNTFGLRSEWSDQVAPDAELRIGTDVLLEPYNVSIPGLNPEGGLHGAIGPAGGPGAAYATNFDSGFRQTDLNASAYAELSWRPTSQVELFPGVRGDVFTTRYPQSNNQGLTAEGRATFDPRLTARWHASPSVAIVSALGVVHQPSNIPLPSPGLNFSQLSRGVQSSFQYSEGVELTLPWRFTATASGFLHDYTGLADYYDSCAQNGQQTCTFDGRAIGLELLVRRRLTERLTGWLSYTLSRTVRDYPTTSDSGGPSRVVSGLSEFDRTHVANAVVAADLGNGWRAGIRVLAYSGLPYASNTFATDTPPDARGPPFVRVDVRLQKTWRALGGKMSFVFEWLNALLQKESLTTTCSAGGYGNPTVTCSPQQLPIPITFPSVGLEGAWGE